MNQAIIALVVFVCGTVVGIFIAYLLWYRPPNDKQILKFMGKLVNLEELETRRKLMRMHLMRVGNRTTRTDSGPNAKIMRMRIRKGRGR